jgi:ABC-type amino acid transport system permease subunit
MVYAAVAGLYFVLCWPLSLLSERLERRLEHAGATTVSFQI